MDVRSIETPPRETASVAIEPQFAGGQNGCGGLSRPACERAETCQQLGEGEGLDGIVVGPAIQAADTVFDGVSGGEHQDRGL